jgi:hypothetical protein
MFAALLGSVSVRRVQAPAVLLSAATVEGRTVSVGITSSSGPIGSNEYTMTMTVDEEEVTPIFQEPGLWIVEVPPSAVNTTVAWLAQTSTSSTSGEVIVGPSLSVPAAFGPNDWSLVDGEVPATVPDAFGDNDWALVEEQAAATVPDAFGDGDWGLELVPNTPPPPTGDGTLTAPQSVTATTQSDRVVRVTWSAPATGTPTSYEVDYSTNQATWTTLTNRTSPADIGDLPIGGQLYYFRVRARNATTSATSGNVSATTHVRAYGLTAEWNIPISQALSRGTHPNETYFRDVLWLGNEAPGGGRNAGTGVSWCNFFSRDYTYPVYKSSDAGGQTAQVSVSAGNWRNGIVPWNPSWTIPAGTDAQIIILDEATGVEYNGFNLRYVGSPPRLLSRDGNTARLSRVTASLDGDTNSPPGDFRTKTNGFTPSRGCGIQYLAMLIRPEEIAQGKIYHALSCVMRRSGFAFFSNPATKGERFPGNDLNQGVPQGTRFYLNITDAEIDAHVASWPSGVPTSTRNTMRIVLKAMQEYGCIASDQGGDNHIQFQHDDSTDWTPYGLDPITVNGKVYPRDAIDGLITNKNRIRFILPSDGVLHYYNQGGDNPARPPVALVGGPFPIRQPGGGTTQEVITDIGRPLIERSGSNTIVLTRRAQFVGRNPVTILDTQWFRGSTLVQTGNTFHVATQAGTYFCRERASNPNGTTSFDSNTITI